MNIKHSIRLITISLSAILLFQSCKKNDSDVAPVISLTEGSVKESSSIAAGDTVTLKFKVVSGNTLTSVEFYTYGGTLINEFSDINSTKVFSYRFVCYAGSQTYKIYVSDTVGFTASYTFTLKTSPKITGLKYGTMKDNDGQSYKTITIGTQTWMAENLHSYTFRDSSAISHKPIDSVWKSTDSAAYCTYNNTQDGSVINQMGNLYNWYAVSSSKGLCPKGWHIPGDDEWQTLRDYIDKYGYGYEGSGDDVAKSLALKSWTNSFNKGELGNSQSTNNTSGFNAAPAGQRNEDGTFSLMGTNTGFWVFDYNRLSYAYVYQLNAYSSELLRNTKDVHQGFSVRCVKD